MSKIDKLLKKLKSETIKAAELRTLLKAKGAYLSSQAGSHEKWRLGNKTMTLATHKKELKIYQMKNAKEFLDV